MAQLEVPEVTSHEVAIKPLAKAAGIAGLTGSTASFSSTAMGMLEEGISSYRFLGLSIGCS